MSASVKGIKLIVIDDKDKVWQFKFGHPDGPANLGFQMEYKNEYAEISNSYSVLRNDLVRREMIVKIRY